MQLSNMLAITQQNAFPFDDKTIIENATQEKKIKNYKSIDIDNLSEFNIKRL